MASLKLMIMKVKNRFSQSLTSRVSNLNKFMGKFRVVKIEYLFIEYGPAITRVIFCCQAQAVAQ